MEGTEILLSSFDSIQGLLVTKQTLLSLKMLQFNVEIDKEEIERNNVGSHIQYLYK